jgi:hypothetical protein
MITDYYSTNGSWPTQLSDLGFDQDSMTSSTVDSVKIGANGEFLAELNNTLGDNKLLVFRPNSVMDGTSIEWTCYANFTREFLTVAGHSICESSNQPEISAASLRPKTSTNITNNSNNDFLRPGERRMLENYEERGRKLKEAKKRSVEEYKQRKMEEEKEEKETSTSPTYSPAVTRDPTNAGIPPLYQNIQE